MSRLASLTSYALLAGALGCAERYSFEDEGRACLFAEEPTISFGDYSPQAFEAGAIAYVGVRIPGCVSSSCTEDLTASCEVELSGSTLRVTSRGGYTRTESLINVCNDNCPELFAVCAMPPSLDAGTYTLLHGAESVEFSIPSSSDRAPCAEPNP